MDSNKYARLGLGRKIQISDAQRRILMERAMDNRRQCDCPGGKICPIGCNGFQDGCRCDENPDGLRQARGMDAQQPRIELPTNPTDEIPF